MCPHISISRFVRPPVRPSVRPSVVVVIVFLVSIVLVIVVTVVIVIIVVIVVFPPTSPILLIGRIASPTDGRTDGLALMGPDGPCRTLTFWTFSFWTFLFGHFCLDI